MKRFIPVILVAVLVSSLAGMIFASNLPVLHVRHETKPLFSAGPGTPHRIAHAGGALHGRAYTNSLEALNANYANGFRYFETDLELTSDGRIVVLHDWLHAYQNFFGTPSITRSAEEFLNSRSPYGYTQMTEDTLIEWADAHPDARIVLDIKGDYTTIMSSFGSKRPDLALRFIPFIYSQGNYELAMSRGFDKPLWLIDYARTADEDVLSFASTHPLSGVAMRADRTASGLPARLSAQGIPSFAWTINNASVGSALLQSSVVGLITDNLLPSCSGSVASIAPLTRAISGHIPAPHGVPRTQCAMLSETVLSDRRQNLI